MTGLMLTGVTIDQLTTFLVALGIVLSGVISIIQWIRPPRRPRGR
jgi:hypothetical protein